jgi:nitrogen fixation protein
VFEVGDGLHHLAGRELLNLRFKFSKNHEAKLGRIAQFDKHGLGVLRGSGFSLVIANLPNPSNLPNAANAFVPAAGHFC